MVYRERAERASVRWLCGTTAPGVLFFSTSLFPQVTGGAICCPSIGRDTHSSKSSQPLSPTPLFTVARRPRLPQGNAASLVKIRESVCNARAQHAGSTLDSLKLYVEEKRRVTIWILDDGRQRLPLAHGVRYRLQGHGAVVAE